MESRQSLSDPVTVLKGVGDTLAQRLAKLGIEQVGDLLFHLPLRYQDKTRIIPLATARAGQEALVEGVIQQASVHFGRRRTLSCTISDPAGQSLILRFFHFSSQQQQQLQAGLCLRCYGEIRRHKKQLEMVHPEYQVVQAGHITPVASTLTPVYPTTEGLQQKRFRDLIAQALSLLQQDTMTELLPDEAKLHEAAKLSLLEAIVYVHQPDPAADTQLLLDKKHPAQRRLAYEELLAQQLSLRQLQLQAQQHQAPALTVSGQLRQAMMKQLPFTLTEAQQRVLAEIDHDLTQAMPMQRLVQGDVGSGKTVIAALAMLAAVDSGYQAVLMAPTELLAEQHYHTLSTWLTPLGVSVAWCMGKQKSQQRQAVLKSMASGQAQLICGTHALFQAEVTFSRLGLVVIDEQHRFGVHQRLALREKGLQATGYPHQLVMTATPIPRTLAMTAYADLNVSVIDTLPPGRTPVTTVVVSESKREQVIQRVQQACLAQRQVYWVCTLVEASEHLQCEAAQETAQDLQAKLGDELTVGLVHGRMKSTEKEAVMAAFKAAEIDLLVATTVIEVGVDVPNASLMVIDNAERLGLAQLHQLRGRVGRGSVESHCVLMYHSPLSANGEARLRCLRDSQDGFMIAQRDLELRGPGELLGAKQTGLPQFRIAHLIHDTDLVAVMPSAAKTMLTIAPHQVEPLVQRWFGIKIDLGQV